MSNDVMVPRVSIEVYIYNDISDQLPDDIRKLVDDTIDNKVSFGDAEYTIIKGTFLERIIHDAFESSGDYSDERKAEILKDIPSLINALIAING
jgi:hypothetical protein